ncbi:MAG: membrane dipeptidase [Anaerolineae bacterium]
MASQDSLDALIDRLQAPGVVDMHFDLLMDLYEKRRRRNVLRDDHLADLRAGDMGIVAAAIYLLEGYLPEMALRVALDHVARLYIEVEGSADFAICRTFSEIEAARQAGKIVFLLTMEGVDPLGNDLNLLRVFYELGVRMVGLTHARRNYAADGAVFAPQGSSRQGLTPFGRQVVRECERLGIIIDLAHINPAGFDDILAQTTRPVVISHTNSRLYYDIERNVTDEQIKAVGARGGVIGVNATLVSRDPDGATIDRFVDHIAHIADLIGIDSVALGFDYFKSLFEALPEAEKEHIRTSMTEVSVIPDLSYHADTRNLTRTLIERGFSDDAIGKILYGNWMRILREML